LTQTVTGYSGESPAAQDVPPGLFARRPRDARLPYPQDWAASRAMASRGSTPENTSVCRTDALGLLPTPYPVPTANPDGIGRTSILAESGAACDGRFNAPKLWRFVL
jgi:hypothetical protein